MSHQIKIRRIERSDNKILASIIRNGLTEFKANKPGTVFFDDTTDNLFEVFQKESSYYFVAQMNDEVTGGAGIYPTQGLPHDTCELVKMYLSPQSRGKGIGKLLMQKCLEQAKQTGYKYVYLETMPELTSAIPMYDKFGFRFLKAAMGNSGHSGCDIWMIKTLQ